LRGEGLNKHAVETAKKLGEETAKKTEEAKGNVEMAKKRAAEDAAKEKETSEEKAKEETARKALEAKAKAEAAVKAKIVFEEAVVRLAKIEEARKKMDEDIKKRHAALALMLPGSPEYIKAEAEIQKMMKVLDEELSKARRDAEVATEALEKADKA